MPRVKLPTTREEWEDLYEGLVTGKDDRTAAILGATLVDANLETMLLSWLYPDKSVEDFFDPLKNGFVSTYGAKVDLAYALGLVDQDERKYCKAIGKIRNVFAHNLLDATFDHADIRKAVSALREVKNSYHLDPKARPRDLFARAVRTMTGALGRRARSPRTPQEFENEVKKIDDAEWQAAWAKQRKKRQT